MEATVTMKFLYHRIKNGGNSGASECENIGPSPWQEQKSRKLVIFKTCTFKLSCNYF